MDHRIKDKSGELISDLKHAFQTEAFIREISGADLYYTDGRAAFYEFKIVQGGDIAFAGGYGFLVLEGDDMFREVIKNWYNKYALIRTN